MTVGAEAVTGFTHTWSGRQVDTVGGHGAPSIVDVAVQCGRTPRFAGATQPPWFVLHHLLACWRMALGYRPGDPLLELAVLVHDAHEACTGDSPSPYKCGCTSGFQAELDARITAAWGLPTIPPAVRDAVKVVDRQALYCEGLVVGPPGKDWIPRHEVAWWGMAGVKWVADRFPDPAASIDAAGEMVRLYVTEVNRLIEETT